MKAKYCKKRTSNKIEHGRYIDICPSCDHEKGIKVSAQRWINNNKKAQ